MLDNSFLQLSEYSNKYGVSLSTLRRRIKSGEVEFEFEQGKYWLKDEPIARYVRNRPQTTDKKPVTEVQSKPTHSSVQEFTESAKSLMTEIKSAFVKALHEKEEQIMELKEEIADLKTLNKILDQENERIKQSSFSGWMDSPSSD